METKDSAGEPVRELTASERKIAVAQIEDRFVRMAKAHAAQIAREKRMCAETEAAVAHIADAQEREEAALRLDDENAASDAAFMAGLRTKYELPDEVYLFGGEDSSCLLPSDIAELRPYITAFVQGSLTPKDCDEFIMELEEFRECDYGWALIERPFGFYGGYIPGDTNGETTSAYMASITAELCATGTRSSRKKIGLYPFRPNAKKAKPAGDGGEPEPRQPLAADMAWLKRGIDDGTIVFPPAPN